MFTIKRWLRKFMGFSRAESNGFIILLPLVALVVFSEPLTRWVIGQREDDFSAQQPILDSLIRLTVLSKGALPKKEGALPRYTKKAFRFNPNLATNATLSQLGLSSQVADRVLKYRAAGGKFTIKSDLMKIYGIDSALYQHLYAYILLPDSITKKPVPDFRSQQKNNLVKNEYEFDLNMADTIQLKTVYGIGSRLASRIVKYRQRIGGFVHPGQLKEIYGLDSLAINNVLKRSFIHPHFEPVKINVNTCTEKDLQGHPYVTKALARAIVTYRFQHGNFGTVQEIKNLQGINASILDKLIPYLKVNE